MPNGWPGAIQPFDLATEVAESWTRAVPTGSRLRLRGPDAFLVPWSGEVAVLASE